MVEVPDEKKRKTKQLKNNEQPDEEKTIKIVMFGKTNKGNKNITVKGNWDEDELKGFVSTISETFEPLIPGYIENLKKQALQQNKEPPKTEDKKQVEEQVQKDLEQEVEQKTE